MKRVMLLALLAMVLPTAALATGIDFSTGSFVRGSLSGSTATTLDMKVVGSNNITIEITTGALAMLAPGIFTFTDGMVTVWSGATQLFTNSLTTPATVLVSQVGSLTTTQITAVLAPFTFNGARIPTGSVNLSLTQSGTNFTNGTGVASLATPEPSTLGLLGTGLIGLAAMVRRKYKTQL